MTTRIFAAAAAIMATAACTAAPTQSVPPPVSDSCRSDATAQFIGQTASSETAARMLAATGSREIRWVPPGTMVTMDYKAGRLTVGYDADMIITTASCG